MQKTRGRGQQAHCGYFSHLVRYYYEVKLGKEAF